MNNSLLYFVHVCMRGSENDPVDDDLYEGTVKSAEGHAANMAFGLAKEDGVNIEVNWQDADSSSANSFHKHYPNGQVMLCSGHVARNQLDAFSKKKTFTKQFINRNVKNFPNMASVTCHCAGSHSKGCGCFSQAFITQVRVNFFCVLSQSGKDPRLFETRLKLLGKYHARNIHSWSNGKCDFHSLKLCTCGECEEDDVQCEGEEYRTKHTLTCPFHALAYEIKCFNRAEEADSIIHPELGRGHSNYCEASHNVLVRFRSKDLQLHRLHFITKTNIGLCQANMSWMLKKKGPSYHWLLDLFKHLNLPVLDGVQEALHKSNESQMTALRNAQTEKAKQYRLKHKNARLEEQEERKRWVKRQSISHSYRECEDDLPDDGANAPDDSGAATLVVTNSKCSKCGGTDHCRPTNKLCPFYKGRTSTKQVVRDSGGDVVGDSASDSSDIVGDSASDSSDMEDSLCICGRDRGHIRTCPMNPSNFRK